MTEAGIHTSRRSVFTAGPIQFDEARAELRVDGHVRALEAKPIALLLALLRGAGAVIGKRALMEAAWGNADHIADTSLTTAMSKLRAGLGDRGRDLIEVVHGSGYRIAAPVEIVAARDPARLAFTLAPGDAVPRRPQWRLERLLGSAPLNDVWLARHDKTQEARVFKFADSTARLETLQREATLSRVLHATLGPRDDLVRITEWNFDERPYWIESAYGGPDLAHWAAAHGELAARPITDRIALAAQLARTVAAAHAAGILHGDLKPTNILVHAQPGAPPLLRLVDFGAGEVSDLTRLAALAITLPHPEAATTGRRTGTLGYIAPEVLAGAPATTAADIYTLGILLYQIATADFSKPLSVGWESDIPDPLLREDIAAAADGDPRRRLASAAGLAERLATLPSRRAALLRQCEQAGREAALAKQVERAEWRRPWVIAAALSLALGLAVATVFAFQAAHDRDQARHDRDEATKRAQLAQAVNLFLTQDLLGRGNPALSGKADETLMDAAQAAEAGIDRRLHAEPIVAGTIYLVLADAFDSRSAFSAARNAYDHAAASFDRAGDMPAATIARLHQVFMEAVSGEAAGLPRAKALLLEAAPRVPQLAQRRAEAEIWLLAGRAMVAMLGGDVKTAQAGFRQAADRADARPGVFDEATRLELRRRYAYTFLRQEDWQTARTLLTALLPPEIALHGARHPETLHVELNLAEAIGGAGQNDAALAEMNRLFPIFVAVFGPGHRMTGDLRAWRSQILTQMGRYDDALADQRDVYAMASAKLGAHSFKALAELTDIAATACRAGEMAPGLQQARSAYGDAQTYFGDNAALTQAAAGNLAFCLIVAGQHEAAVPFLAKIGSAARTQMADDANYAAEIALMRADIALAANDAAQAEIWLKQAAPAFGRPGADRYLQRWADRLDAQCRRAAAK